MTQGDEEQTSSTACAVKDVIQALGKYEIDGTVLEEDATQIKNVLESMQIKSLINVYDKLSSARGQRGTRRDFIKLCIDIMAQLERYEDDRCRELFRIMNNPYFRNLIEAHDNIVYGTYKMEPSLPPPDDTRKPDEIGPPIRVVGLTKSMKEPLGIALGKHLDDCIYIKRILAGTMVEKQGLLAVGDIIKEINGTEVESDPTKVENLLKSLDGDVTIKVIPAFKDTHGNCHVFLRCHFDYNPDADEQFPRDEIGLSFENRDIIQITDQSDPKWWQATHLNDSENPTSGLVPSLKFEQMRRTYLTKHKGDKVFKGKKKIAYKTSEHAMFDCLDMQIYEEVTKMPAMERKVIVLVGAEGIGRRTIKRRLIQNYPHQYSTSLPDTSREPREEEVSGRGYHFVDRDKMAADISAGKYLEWGEYKQNLYGTKLDAIRDIINAGKICVIDCNPSALKILKTAEFMPLIVFIESPNIKSLVSLNQQKENYVKAKSHKQMESIVSESVSINNIYHHYFDLQIINENHDKSYNILRENIDKIIVEPQWVPVSWVY